MAVVGVVSTLLEVREVSKAFGGVQAVTAVSLDVVRGEILSVIGPTAPARRPCST
jgi:ABC-type branched-subunit amino acid transport system ATPase component